MSLDDVLLATGLPTLPQRGGVITPKALLRRGRTAKAALRVNTGVLVSSLSQPDGQLSRDQYIEVDQDLPETDVGEAKLLGLQLRETRGGRVKIVPPRSANEIGRVSSRLEERFKIAAYAQSFDQPEMAVRVTIKDGRTVTIPGFLSRLAQTILLLTVGDRIDQCLPNTAHAFRRGRNPETALFHARHSVRKGNPFALVFDIRKFFHETRIDEVVEPTLAIEAPFLSPELRRLMLFELRPPILDRTQEPERMIERPSGLAAGMTIVPCLANLVGARHLDWPVAEEFGANVTLIRYADDCLLLGPTEAVVLEALQHCDDALQGVGLRRHPDKGTLGRVVDVREARIPYLGYEIGRNEVRLPYATHRRWIDRIASADENKVRRLAHAFRSQLVFDNERRVRRSLLRLRAQSGPRAAHLEQSLERRKLSQGKLHARMTLLLRG